MKQLNYSMLLLHNIRLGKSIFISKTTSETIFLLRYNDAQLGGIESTLPRLLSSDPSCITSRILATGLDLMGTASASSSLHSKTLKSLGDRKSSNEYVNLHVHALLDFSKGYFREAAETWERILILYPFDMMSIKFAADAYFYTGDREMLRDSIARVLPIWDSSTDRPLKSYLHGMYAFGLGETNMILRAEQQARLGLELNEHDAWATHELAHAIEYTGRISEGINFLEKSQNHWQQCDTLAPHINWHWALYELEQDNWEKAEEILQNCYLNNNEVELTRLKYTDAASLIYRQSFA